MSELWFHASDEDAEVWTGPLDSRDAAIAEGRSAAYYDGEAFAVCKGEAVTVEQLLSDSDLDRAVDYIAEMAGEYWGENLSCPEDADADELVFAKDAKAARDALKAWAVEHLRCKDWYEMTGNAETIPAEGDEV